MSATASEAELLAAVEQSPRAVAAHDRTGWVGLFTRDGRIEDPVGSRPHVGTAAIERFYDTFIAPNSIVFDVEHDVVCGMSVFRDLAIEITMAGVALRVPMHLRYDLVRSAETLEIAELRAHWELPVMVGQLLASGLPGLRAAATLGPRLVGNQGIGGTVGFARGFVRVSAAGKRLATDVLAAAGRGSVGAVRNGLSPGAVVEWPVGNAITPEEFVARAAGVRIGKPISAGRFVTATVESTAGRGVAELEVASGGRRVAMVRIFAPD
ncbi:ketosteroid isomerase family protein [Nocardia sp. CDC159]|uniref:Ketosteroid isomerase family protein n=1 Tax=Nocardia pulmonis TaxID=2951408 RepID=A0A9X2E3E5_9NOCA|nr:MULTISPECIES: ketosteroid isomerase family protein [Nocardia]MCM6773489.1 ketosteroid isomerase family protein [Nocardia pulmonis]MCM6786376.1 ketosteroid isomerase family protein [Nocardia sp. CDC159]